MNSKFFSIIIPVYNPTRLKRALDSIESQECKELLEVIIVDDKSQDKSYQDILQNYTFDYTLIENEKNVGQGMARQIGLDRCHGEWVTFLDHDDEFNPDCFKNIKEFIDTNGCEFVLNTNTIIANDYNWVNTNLFQVSDENNFLHGKFYKKEKLDKYNIRFHEELRSQEDTYFISLIEGYIILDKDNFDENKTKMFYPIVSYYWYLWGDSTSHKTSIINGENISYLENTFNDYIRANYESYKICSSSFQEDIMFKYSRCISLLDYCYWFYESFKYCNPKGFKKDNIKYVCDLRDTIIDELGCKDKYQLVDIIMKFPEMYQLTGTAMLSNAGSAFIPLETIQDFFINM